MLLLKKMKKKKRKYNLKFKVNKKIIIIFVIVLFLISTYLIFRIVNSNQKEKQEIDEVADVPFYESLIPLRNWQEDVPTVRARSALVAYVDSSGNKKYLFEKDKDIKIPIASITKLMTTLIVLEQYDLEETIFITEDAFLRDLSRQNNFYVGEQYKVKELLYPLLMESSNTSAYALAQRAKDPNSRASIASFVNLMNQKAKELGMHDTFFINPCGLDPQNVNDTANYSSAKDLTILIENLLDKSIVWEILSLPQYRLIRSDGFPKHTIINTNNLINELPGMIGGKTGTTLRALQCFVVVVEKENQDYLIGIILGSSDRFNEMKKIIDWSQKGYYWQIM